MISRLVPRLRFVAVYCVLSVIACSANRTVNPTCLLADKPSGEIEEAIGRYVVVTYSDGQKIKGTLVGIGDDHIQVETGNQFVPVDVPWKSVAHMEYQDGHSAWGMAVFATIGGIVLVLMLLASTPVFDLS